MTLSLIILFKGVLGGGGVGLDALLFAIILIYWLYRNEKYGDSGCVSILLLPILPFSLIISLFSKADEKCSNISLIDKQFDYPPSLLLKVFVAISCIGLWILGICFIACFDESGWWSIIWGIFMPLISINLYLLWLKVFFVWLGRMKTSAAITVAIITIIILVVFWIVAIKAYNYYTSLEYLREYWIRKYSVM